MVGKPREILQLLRRRQVQNADLATFLVKYELGLKYGDLPQQKRDFYNLKADSILTFISIFENRPKKRGR
jgi:hypothetical protein